MNILQRSVLSVLLFVVSIISLIVLAWNSVNSDIKFAESEIAGAEFTNIAQSTLQVMTNMHLTRLSKAAKIPTSNFDGNLSNQAMQEYTLAFANGLAALQLDDKTLNAKGCVNCSIKDIQAAWQQYLAVPDGDLGQLGSKFEIVMQGYLNVIGYVNITSSLILDPVLNTYFVADTVMGRLPTNQQRLVQTLHMLLATSVNSANLDKMALNSMTVMLEQNDRANVDGDLATAYSNPTTEWVSAVNLAAQTQPLLTSYDSSIKGLIGVLGDVVNGKDIPQPALLIGNYSSVLSNNYNLELQSLAQLNDMLNSRAQFYHGNWHKTLFVCLFGLAVSAAFFAYNILNIVRPLQHLQAIIARIIKGEAAQIKEVPHLERSDEIGSFAEAIGAFREAEIRAKDLERQQGELKAQHEREQHTQKESLAAEFNKDVKSLVDTVKSTSQELNKVSGVLADSSLVSVKQITDLSQQHEGNYTELKKTVVTINEAADYISGIKELTDKSSGSLDNFAKKATAANEISQEPDRSVENISSIVSIINDIAEQINLLALNATIEAARAGESGKGFAVVAGEVKNLAGQTSKAINEINDSIMKVKNSSHNTVETLRHITEGVVEVSATTKSLSQALSAQNKITNDIRDSILHVASVTEEFRAKMDSVIIDNGRNVEFTRELQSYSGDLAHQSDSLQGTVSHFIESILRKD